MAKKTRRHYYNTLMKVWLILVIIVVAFVFLKNQDSTRYEIIYNNGILDLKEKYLKYNIFSTVSLWSKFIRNSKTLSYVDDVTYTIIPLRYSKHNKSLANMLNIFLHLRDFLYPNKEGDFFL